jgi:hypothetical protein
MSLACHPPLAFYERAVNCLYILKLISRLRSIAVHILPHPLPRQTCHHHLLAPLLLHCPHYSNPPSHRVPHLHSLLNHGLCLRSRVGIQIGFRCHFKGRWFIEVGYFRFIRFRTRTMGVRDWNSIVSCPATSITNVHVPVDETVGNSSANTFH